MTNAQEQGRAQLSEEALAARSELLEREGELAAIELLISATDGLGQLFAIEGPPGIGKTSLVQLTKARAQEARMQELGARGSELKRTFSYGVVRQLFEPFLTRLPEEERRELLAGAAALAMPLFDPAQLAAEHPTDASLARLHGLYWLTANVAARRPLLLAVDDLHWCDPPVGCINSARPAGYASLQGESSSRTARRRGSQTPAAVRPLRAKSHSQPRFVSE